MCVPMNNKKLLEGGAYILGAVILTINIVFMGFRINNFTKDWEELFEPVAGTDKYRRDFSFYIYEKTFEAHKRHINVLGSIGFAINLVSALSAVLGLVGVYKKIPVLVRIWAYGLALYLGWWTFWAVIEPSVLATDFTIPHWAVTIATISAVLFILACTFFVYALTVLASQICEENEQKSQVVGRLAL